MFFFLKNSKEILLSSYLTSPECDKEKRSFAPLVLFFQCFIYITALLMITVNVYLKKMGCWTPWPPGGYCATYRHVNDTEVKWKQFLFVFTYFGLNQTCQQQQQQKKQQKRSRSYYKRYFHSWLFSNVDCFGLIFFPPLFR